MKPIIKQKQQDEILTTAITNKHLVCMITSGREPLLLTRRNYNKGGYFPIDISEQFTNCNSWWDDSDTIKGAVENAMSKGAKVEVFKQSDWKLALQWLIDNA